MRLRRLVRLTGKRVTKLAVGYLFMRILAQTLLRAGLLKLLATRFIMIPQGHTR